MSHHIGDLENLETLTSFTEGIEHFKRLFDIQPAIIAHDMHPEYLSTRWTQEVQRSRGAGGKGEIKGGGALGQACAGRMMR